MSEPREYTTEEVRTMFLEEVWKYVDYWSRESLANSDCQSRLEGLAFSILVLLDGGTEFPACIVAPDPHEDDREFRKSEGDNWFPENYNAEVEADISGVLHELFYKGRRR